MLSLRVQDVKIMMPSAAKYIDLLTDFGFKRVFGDKELLRAFLNALFEKEGKVIKSVRYINKEMTLLTRQTGLSYTTCSASWRMVAMSS